MWKFGNIFKFSIFTVWHHTADEVEIFMICTQRISYESPSHRSLKIGRHLPEIAKKEKGCLCNWHKSTKYRVVESHRDDGRCASPRIWNELPDSFRQPHQSCLDSPSHSLVSVIIITLVIPSLLYPRLKTYLFNKSFPYLNRLLVPPGLPSRITGLDRT